ALARASTADEDEVLRERPVVAIVLHGRAGYVFEGAPSQASGASGSKRPTTAQPIESDQTFTLVRAMSRTRSTAMISPTPSTGSPTAVRTTTIITAPACGIPAAPTLARSAVSATTICW